MADVPKNEKFQSIHEMANEQLAALGPRVMAEVASRMAEREVKKRTDKMVQALDRAATMTVDHLKLGPDNVGYNAEGQKTSESYSKKRLDEINKSQSNIAKLQSAIAKADSSGDYGDLDKLLAGGPKSETEGGTKDSGDVAKQPPNKDS